MAFEDYYHHLPEDELELYYNDVECTNEDNVPIRKLFIGNLAERTTYKDLAKLFRKYGEVESCFLKRSQGKSNYAFITFSDTHAAWRARCEFITLHNRHLRVIPANSWHQPDNKENDYYNAKEWQKCDKMESNKLCDQYVQNDISRDSIQRLDDDSLSHIFLQLPIVDRVRIERVCKRWRAVSEASWHNMQILDLSRSLWGISAMKMRTFILRKVLLRCGRFVNEIKLNSPGIYYLQESTLTFVSKLCPNLQDIQLTDCTVSTAGINSLTKYCHDIRKLSLSGAVRVRDKDLESFFKVHQRLKHFEIESGNISGHCLLSLPSESMESMVLRNCMSLKTNILAQAITQLTNIKSLTLSQCMGISTTITQAISTYCTKLQSLELCRSRGFVQFPQTEILHITRLCNLETLNLNEHKSVDDKFLFELALNCRKLTCLDISNCYKVTGEGASAILTLPNLEILRMNNLPGGTDDINVQGICNLKQLECRSWTLSDKIVIEFIKYCPKLQLFDLSGCGGLTKDLLKEVAAITTRRVNNTVLKLYIGTTGISEFTELDNVSPFLQIVNVNCSYLEKLFGFNESNT